MDIWDDRELISAWDTMKADYQRFHGMTCVSSPPGGSIEGDTTSSPPSTSDEKKMNSESGIPPEEVAYLKYYYGDEWRDAIQTAPCDLDSPHLLREDAEVCSSNSKEPSVEEQINQVLEGSQKWMQDPVMIKHLLLSWYHAGYAAGRRDALFGEVDALPSPSGELVE